MTLLEALAGGRRWRVPYTGEIRRVVPYGRALSAPGAREALDSLMAAGSVLLAYCGGALVVALREE